MIVSKYLYFTSWVITNPVNAIASQSVICKWQYELSSDRLIYSIAYLLFDLLFQKKKEEKQ